MNKKQNYTVPVVEVVKLSTKASVMNNASLTPQGGSNKGEDATVDSEGTW